jgi:hypothetical protein
MTRLKPGRAFLNFLHLLKKIYLTFLTDTKEIRHLEGFHFKRGRHFVASPLDATNKCIQSEIEFFVLLIFNTLLFYIFYSINLY